MKCEGPQCVGVCVFQILIEHKNKVPMLMAPHSNKKSRLAKIFNR